MLIARKYFFSYYNVVFTVYRIKWGFTIKTKWNDNHWSFFIFFSFSGYLDERDEEDDRQESHREVHQRNSLLLHQVIRFLVFFSTELNLNFSKGQKVELFSLWPVFIIMYKPHTVVYTVINIQHQS